MLDEKNLSWKLYQDDNHSFHLSTTRQPIGRVRAPKQRTALGPKPFATCGNTVLERFHSVVYFILGRRVHTIIITEIMTNKLHTYTYMHILCRPNAVLNLLRMNYASMLY